MVPNERGRTDLTFGTSCILIAPKIKWQPWKMWNFDSIWVKNSLKETCKRQMTIMKFVTNFMLQISVFISFCTLYNEKLLFSPKTMRNQKLAVAQRGCKTQTCLFYMITLKSNFKGCHRSETLLYFDSFMVKLRIFHFFTNSASNYGHMWQV